MVLVIANHRLSDTFPFNTHVVFGADIVVVTRTFERFVDAYSIHTHVGCARVVVITNHERPNTGPTDATVVYSTGITVITKQGVIWDQTILISSGDTGHARVERVDGAFFVAVTIYKTPAWVRLMMAISFKGSFTVVVSTVDFIVAEFRKDANALAIFIAGVVVCAGSNRHRGSRNTGLSKLVGVLPVSLPVSYSVSLVSWKSHHPTCRLGVSLGRILSPAITTVVR